MLKRKLFTADHESGFDTARKFFEREIMPHHERWEEQASRSRAWLKAGQPGLLCMTMPSEELTVASGVDRLAQHGHDRKAARVRRLGPRFLFALENRLATSTDIATHQQAWLPRVTR